MANCGYKTTTVYTCPVCGAIWAQPDWYRHVKCHTCKKYGYDKHKKGSK